MSDFARSDIGKRRNGTTQIEEFEFLERLNSFLSAFDKKIVQADTEEQPIIWILGLPRSGTTLASQLLTYHLETAWVDNVAARFWKAPVTGLRLSKLLKSEEYRPQYSSHYGKGQRPSHIHEFSYFWHDWLKMNNMPPYEPEKAVADIDWTGLRETILSMAAVNEKPMIFKALDAGYHAPRFAELFPKSVFVYISRNLIDVACSLAKARIDHYGTLGEWWSMFPKEYEDLVDLPYYEQIVGQVHFLNQNFTESLSAVNKKRVIHTQYQEICADPIEFINRVSKGVSEWCGTEIPQLGQPPTRFEPTSPRVDHKIRAEIEKASENFRAATP